jgi:ABC-type branched-subunit amino acid transport system substrate-binding protein
VAASRKKPQAGRSSMWSDKSALIRSGVVSVGLVLSLAACGVMMPGGNSPGGGPAQPVAGDGPGVTSDTVKVVFVGTDLKGVEAITGFVTEDAGDQKKQVEALEKWVNANGGLGDRKMEAVYRLYDAVTDTPATEEQLCKRITQDDKAFAVVLTGQYQPNARPCYQQAKTLMLDAALMASDQTFYDQMYPYLWAPSFAEYGAFARAQMDVLAEEGFLYEGQSMGVVAADSDINKRVYKDIVEPRLAEAGIPFQVSWIDTTDMGSLFSTLPEAATQFRNKEFNNVMFLGGSRMASLFDAVAASVQFKARYAMSSYDNPTYFINNPGQLSIPGMRSGMVGVGFHPPQEVITSIPFPNENEADCISIYKEAGISWDTREGARVALPFCDAAKLLKLGADAMDDGDFNAFTWAKGVEKDADKFQTASGFGNGLANGNAGAGAYRVMRFDDASEAFVYDDEERSFDAAQ